MPVVNRTSLAAGTTRSAAPVSRPAVPQHEPKAGGVAPRPTAIQRPVPRPTQPTQRTPMATPQRPTVAARPAQRPAAPAPVQRPAAPAPAQRTAPAKPAMAPRGQVSHAPEPGDDGSRPAYITLRDVVFYWCKLDPENPVPNWAGDSTQWEIQVRVPIERIDEIEGMGKIKSETDDNGQEWAAVNLYQRAVSKAGKPLRPPKVVDAHGEELPPTIVGNGSYGDIMVQSRPYQLRHPKTNVVTKEGIAHSPYKLRIRDLVEYTGQAGPDFDDYEDVPVDPAGEPGFDDAPM